jgi:hypothetical protein
MFCLKIFRIDEFVSKQWLNPWITQCAIKFFHVDLLDFVTNVS